MMLSLTTGPATSAFRPAPTINPIPARASGASWPKRETRARPVQLVPPARLAPPEPPEPRVLKGQPIGRASSRARGQSAGGGRWEGSAEGRGEARPHLL